MNVIISSKIKTQGRYILLHNWTNELKIFLKSTTSTYWNYCSCSCIQFTGKIQTSKVNYTLQKLAYLICWVLSVSIILYTKGFKSRLNNISLINHLNNSTLCFRFPKNYFDTSTMSSPKSWTMAEFMGKFMCISKLEFCVCIFTFWKIYPRK